MTNATIILNESIELMNKGILEGTGEFIKTVDGKEIEIPEPIHTYKRWQDLGFQVRKGEKAIASFNIWKCSEQKAKELEENQEEEKNIKMFMKKASFFKLSQLELIQAAN